MGITLDRAKLLELKLSQESGSSEGKDRSLELGSSDEKPNFMEYDEELEFFKNQMKPVSQMSQKEREAFIQKEKEAFFGSPDSDGLSSLDKEESYDLHWQRGQGPLPGMREELEDIMEVDEAPPTPKKKKVPEKGSKSSSAAVSESGQGKSNINYNYSLNSIFILYDCFLFLISFLQSKNFK